MNKLVLSALAATVVVGTTSASEGEWAGLDAELTALSTNLSLQDGPSVSGYLEATYDTQADDDEFGIRRNRLGVYGDNYGVSISGNEDADAYVMFDMGGMSFTMGTFRAPGTANDGADEAGTAFSSRDFGNTGDRVDGIATSGTMSGLAYTLHFGDDSEVGARASYDVISGDGVNMSVAWSRRNWIDDSDADPANWTDNDGDNIEVNLSSGAFAVSATSGDGGKASVGDDASSLTATYTISDNWTLSLRTTDHDTGDGGAEELFDWALTSGAWTIQSLESNDAITGEAEANLSVSYMVSF